MSEVDRATERVSRERRLANLRATLGRTGTSGSGVQGPLPAAPAPVARAAARSRALAVRVADALGASVIASELGTLVRIDVADHDLPLDRRRLADLPGQPPVEAPLVCLDTETTGLATAAGTLAFLVGLGWWEGDRFRQTHLFLPDHADEPALLATLAARIPPQAWLVTYNGRGFDWPLIEARYRLAGRAAPAHAGHLDLLPLVRRLFRHRLDDARLRTVEIGILGSSRGADVEGWEIPAIYLDALRGGPVEALAAVIRHNEHDVRSLARLMTHLERRLGDRASRRSAPRGDLAGLARAFARETRHLEALEAIDDATACPGPTRDPFGRSPLPAPDAERSDEPWWTARQRPDFGGRRPAGGWRGPGGGRRGGGLGPAPSATAWESADRWTDERLAAERARLLRRLGRHAEAVEAWSAAAMAPGALGIVAWVEVAKLREHHLGDPVGAFEATRAAWRACERSRALGRPLLRLERDLVRRAGRLRLRLAREARRSTVAVGAA
jgi:hypothetical protein